jgi:hypothetical protein
MMKIFTFNDVPSSVLVSAFPRPAQSRPMAVIFGTLKFLLLLGLLPAATATATTYYVDSSVSGGNGTSWASAWSSIGAISGVKGGDVVYISGGPSGSSHTYPISGSWSPVGGSSGSPVTYQIGQDSAHNGTAILSGSSAQYFLSPKNYTVISGDAGDGNMHFATSGYGGCVSLGSAAGVRVSFVNFGSIPTGVDGASSSGGPSNFEFDHCYVQISDPAGDHFMFITPIDTAYDGTRIHNNTVLVPRAPAGDGADAFQIDGSGGWSLYSNTVTGYLMSYTGAQHQDGVQTLAGTYVKIYANTFSDLANSDIFLDGYGGSFTHFRIYDNVGQFTSSTIAAGGGAGIDAQPDGYPVQTPGFNDVIICNNLIADIDGPPGVEFGSPPGSNKGNPGGVSYSGCYAYNNILINCGTFDTYGSPVANGNNISLSTAQATAYFSQYKPLSPANNYRLTAAAASLIGQGVNESTFFNTDIANNTRPVNGAWDVGPYMYGAGASGPALALAAISANASDVDPNTAGLQVYEGTTVQFTSASAYSGTNTLNWKWTYAVNGGSTVVYQSGTGSVPGVSFNFAAGTANNTYVWTVLATAGTNSASASMTMSVESPPAPNTSLTFQAPSGTLTAPMTATGTYISQSVTSTTISATGEALYNFNITNAGNYVIQATVNAPNDSANSMYVNIDAQPVDPTMTWDIFPYTTNFQNRLVSWRGTGTDTNNQFTPKIFSLALGAHQIVFAGREANVQLQSFSLLELPATPQNLRVLQTVAGNAPSFSAGP